MSEAVPSIDLPFYLRRTLGLRTRRTIPFDDAYKLRWGEPIYMLTHPDDVRHVLITNSENYTKSRYLSSARGKLRAGRGLLTSSGQEHRRQRRLLQPLFHERVVARFCPTILSRVDRLLDRLEVAPEVDLATAMADLTQSVILGVLFGTDLRHEDEQLARAIRTRRSYTQYVYHGRLPFRTRLPTPIVRAHRSALRYIDEAIFREIAFRRNDPAERPDLLSLLMTSTYPDGSGMNDRQLRDEVLTFTSTGYETLAEALTWTWYLLSRHPEVEQRLLEELNDVLANRLPTVEDVRALAFTKSVLRESMRLYPPTWIFERVPVERDVLPSGAVVPAGAKLYICQWVMHRHPRHFPDPEAFRPERFAGAGRRPFRFAYLPFGDGVHTCLGETFAMLQGILVLASIGRRFGFEVLPEQRVLPRAGITLGPRHGLRARARAR